jgi:hypothetical protein
MFDILPEAAVPASVQTSQELEHARKQSRDLFRTLPESAERSSILSALGRIGNSTLKQKVRYRAQKIVESCPDRFPDLMFVPDQAINCRNFFVHGGKSPLDYGGNGLAINFFIDTLEFVFAASDLIEAGWDFQSWAHALTSRSRPFGSYKVEYLQSFRRLKTLFATSSIDSVFERE